MDFCCCFCCCCYLFASFQIPSQEQKNSLFLILTCTFFSYLGLLYSYFPCLMKAIILSESMQKCLKGRPGRYFCLFNQTLFMCFLFIGMNISNCMDFPEVVNHHFKLDSPYSPTFYSTVHQLLIALNFPFFTV